MMANSYPRSIPPAVEITPDYLNHRDEEVMHALVTAGALVALADGRLDDVERDELVAFIDQREFVPAFSPSDIAKAFNDRVRQLDDRYSPNLIIGALRPLAGLSLTSIVIRTAQRVAAADRKIHPGELHAVKLIRLIMMSLPAKRARERLAPSSSPFLRTCGTQRP
ncbi:MAG: tellurite resistance TerB family protein [Xanthobacteraceae bacterium]